MSTNFKTLNGLVNFGISKVLFIPSENVFINPSLPDGEVADEAITNSKPVSTLILNFSEPPNVFLFSKLPPTENPAKF